MTFAPSTPGAVRTSLVTTRDAISEELAGLHAPSDQAAYLTQLGLWCSREAVRDTDQPHHKAGSAA